MFMSFTGGPVILLLYRGLVLCDIARRAVQSLLGSRIHMTCVDKTI